jgi:hypothetical protein
MSISNYLCRVMGEDPARVSRLHESTQKRLKAFAIAIHIPVTLWIVTGYLIAARIFQIPMVHAAGVAAFCAVLVGADPNLSHRADRILSQGWKPTLGVSAVDKFSS